LEQPHPWADTDRPDGGHDPAKRLDELVPGGFVSAALGAEIEARKQRIKRMENLQSINQRYEAITWGGIFILVGIIGLIPGVVPGAGSMGIGVILLVLNGVRLISKIPINRFTLIFGLVAVILGAAVLVGSLQGYQLDGPLFPALLIAIGIYWIIPDVARSK
jgi:hypothetical protein